MADLGKGFLAKRTYYEADPKQIRVKEGFNPRFDLGSIEELAEDIYQNGIKSPVIVRRNSEGELELITGHRRMAAVRMLLSKGTYIPTIPVFLEPKGTTDTDALIIDLISNNQKPLLPLEEAAAFKRLIDSGVSIDEIARRIGRSVTFVTGRLLLLQAPAEVQEKVKAGALPQTLAQEIIENTKDEEERKQLSEKAASGKEGRREVRQEIEKRRQERRQERQKSPAKAPSSVPLSAVESLLLDARAKVEKSLDSFATADELDSLEKLFELVQGNDQMMLAFCVGMEFAYTKLLGQPVPVVQL